MHKKKTASLLMLSNYNVLSVMQILLLRPRAGTLTPGICGNSVEIIRSLLREVTCLIPNIAPSHAGSSLVHSTEDEIWPGS